MKTWDESQVREWSVVTEGARRDRQRIHVGSIFGICTEKNAELPTGDPRRKMKGRIVFRGNQVSDEDDFYAVFADLGSALATLLAARVPDSIALME